MNFEKAIEYVLEHEGGYVDDPTDRGGETNYGISKRAYPEVDIKHLTKSEAINIYKIDYWIKGKCDKLPFSLQYAHFDACVNLGIHGANKVLQTASNVKADGIIGSMTIKAVKDISIELYIIHRLYKYCQIVRHNNSQAKYIGGWSNRMMTILDRSK